MNRFLTSLLSELIEFNDILETFELLGIEATRNLLVEQLDEVFEEYRARGVNSVSDVIITKEERDANPIACDRNSEAGWFEGSYKYKPSEAFMTWVFESSDNWFFFDE